GETDFTYTVSDGNGGSDTATVTIDVSGVNDCPVAVNDTAETTEDNAVTFNPLGNDSDVENDALTITQIDGQDISVGGSVDVDHGSVTLNADGTVTFTPDDDYSGTQDFEYTVSDGTDTTTATASVDVEAVADMPDLSVSVEEAGTVEQSATITYQGSEASYHNTYGYYTINEAGEPVGGKIVFADLQDQTPGDSFTLEGVDQDSVGFFLLSDGDAENTGLFNGMDVSFAQDDNGNWQVIGADGEPLNHDANGGLYFTDQELNEDNLDHENDVGNVDGNQNWEDQDNGYNGNDFDYDDGSFDVVWENDTSGTVYNVNIDAAITDVDNSESLSITIDNFPEGATFNMGEIVDGVLVISGDDLDNLDSLTMTVPEGAGDFTLDVSATATEPNGSSATRTASTFVDVNQGPVGNNDTADTTEDHSVTIDLVGNDTDVDGDSLTITQIDGQDISVGGSVDVDHGSVTLNADGTVTFTPDGDYSGTQDFEYTVTDGTDTTTATASVDVEAVADAPDITLGLGAANVVSIPGESHDVTINSDNYDATDSGFTVSGRSIVNGELTEASTDNVGVHENNPLGFGVVGSTQGDGANVEIGYDSATGQSEQLIVDFDDDVSSAEVSFSWQNSREDATYELYKDGVKVGEGRVHGGSDGIDPAITVTADNGADFDQIVFSAPEDNDDFLINSIEFEVSDGGESYVEFPITLTAAETDVDGSESLSAVTLSGLPEGAVVLVDGEEVSVTDGSVQLDSSNLDDVVIRVAEGSEDFDLTASVTSTEPNGDSATSTTSLTVDVPEVNNGPDASDDTASVNEDASVVIDLVANDTDLDGDSLSVTQIAGQDVSVGDSVDVGNGSVTLNEDGTVTFTPDGDYSGSESFEYTVSDGIESTTATATVDVEAIADAPSLTLSLGEGESVTVEGEAEGESGTITVNNYDTTDGVSVTGYDWKWVENGNSTGGGKGDSSGGKWVEVESETNVAETGGGIGVDGHNSDDDINDGEKLIFSFDNDMSSVTVEFDSFSYNEHASYELYQDGELVGSGSFDGNDRSDDTFTFTATDGQSFDQFVVIGENCADFHIEQLTYTAAAGGDDVTYMEYPVNLSAAETDVDGSETLSGITLSGLPDDAILMVDGVAVEVTDGSAVISLDDLDSVKIRVPEGGDDFNLTASVTSTDGSDTATTTQSVAVEAPASNEGPVATDDALSASEDTTETFDLVANDTDADGDSLSIIQIAGQDVAVGDTVDVGNGTVTLNEDGSINFMPDDNFSGEVSFDYTVSDGNGGTDTGTASIDVEGVADGAQVSVEIGSGTVVDTSQDGDSGTISASNLNSTSGVSITAYDEGSTSTYNITTGNSYGESWIGVESGWGDSAITDNEQLIVSFDEDIADATINFKDLGHCDDGKYVLYSDGEVVGTGTFDGNDDTLNLSGNAGVSFDQVVIEGVDGSFKIASIDYTEEGESSSAVQYPVTFAVTMGDESESLSGDALTVDLSGVPAGSQLVIGDATVTVGENGSISVTSGDDVSVDGTTLSIPRDTLGEDLSVSGTITVPTDENGSHGIFDLTASVQTVDGSDTSDVATDSGQVGTGTDAVVENVPHEYMEFDEAVETLDAYKSVDGTSGDDYLTADSKDWETNGQEVYQGGAGDDIVGNTNQNYGNDVMAGGSGDDTVSGGAQNDIIYGDDGNNLDSIPDDNANNGDDTLYGDSGDDTLYGEGGDDVLIGGSNDDFLVGGSGNDTLDGGTDRDVLHGGSGDDMMYGGSNDDTLYGGSGDDTMYGGTNNDFLEGNSGNDTIYGEANADTISGGAGDDTLDGGSGDDVISGGAGNDVILGGGNWGHDTMMGGDGNDLFIFDGATHDSVNGNDWVDGGADFDTIQLNGSEGWTLTITNEDGTQDVVTSETAQMDEYSDASGMTGQIDFDDGSTVIFEGVEKVEW
ncbi:MAG: cadherin-like domain-containing protein, partial [Methylocystaceae bacterium]|nr:cadherin-like domain-containing protein [Methylocystaceae bacterium]